MSRFRSHFADAEIPTPGRGAALVFLLLTSMGLAALTPCVLLPEWRKYELLDRAAQIEQYKLDRLNQRIVAEQTRLDALCRDPGAVARLAQRDLGYRRKGMRSIPVAAMTVPDEPGEMFRPLPVTPPAVVLRAVAFLPELDYDRIFCDRETRPIVMLMSIGLIVTAFAVFHPHRD
ncbi:MAG: hypothetical protein ACE5E5_00995 [Phycisphaerae bacterium]